MVNYKIFKIPKMATTNQKLKQLAFLLFLYGWAMLGFMNIVKLTTDYILSLIIQQIEKISSI